MKQRLICLIDARSLTSQDANQKSLSINPYFANFLKQLDEINNFYHSQVSKLNIQFIIFTQDASHGLEKDKFYTKKDIGAKSDSSELFCLCHVLLSYLTQYQVQENSPGKKPYDTLENVSFVNLSKDLHGFISSLQIQNHANIFLISPDDDLLKEAQFQGCVYAKTINDTPIYERLYDRDLKAIGDMCRDCNVKKFSIILNDILTKISHEDKNNLADRINNKIGPLKAQINNTIEQLNIYVETDWDRAFLFFGKMNANDFLVRILSPGMFAANLPNLLEKWVFSIDVYHANTVYGAVLSENAQMLFKPEPKFDRESSRVLRIDGIAQDDDDADDCSGAFELPEEAVQQNGMANSSQQLFNQITGTLKKVSDQVSDQASNSNWYKKFF